MLTLLKATGLNAGYGRAEVLHGLNLVADAGRVITVIGRASCRERVSRSV